MTPGPANSASEVVSGAHGAAIFRLLERPVSQTDLAAGAEWAARPAIAHEGPMVGLLLFGLGEETAALPARLLRRVTPWARAAPIPHRTTTVMRGMCNIRGELILCADLHRLLGLQTPPRRHPPAEGAGDTRRMVVIGPQEAPWTFEVDRLVGIERTPVSSIRRPPVTIEYALAAYSTGIAEFHGQVVTVLDGERILSGFQAGLA
jgi:chemotaxis signal transduction protein